MATCDTARSVIPEISHCDTSFILTAACRKRMIAHRFEKRTEAPTMISMENRSNHVGWPCRRIADRDGGMRSGHRYAPAARTQACDACAGATSSSDRAGAAVERGRSPCRHRLAAESFVSARTVSGRFRRLGHHERRELLDCNGQLLAGLVVGFVIGVCVERVVIAVLVAVANTMIEERRQPDWWPKNIRRE